MPEHWATICVLHCGGRGGCRITVKKKCGLSSPEWRSSTPGTGGKVPVDIPFGLGAGANHSQPLCSPSPISGVLMCSALCCPLAWRTGGLGKMGVLQASRGTAWIHTGHRHSSVAAAMGDHTRWRAPPEPRASPSSPCRADLSEGAEAATGQQKLVADVQTQS